MFRNCNQQASQVFQLSNTFTWRAPVPQDSCSKESVRKDWRDLSSGEKNAYINAVNELRTTPSKVGRRSFYDDLVAVHGSIVALIHQNVTFFIFFYVFLKKNNIILALVLAMA
jgi:hypothetical protein